MEWKSESEIYEEYFPPLTDKEEELFEDLPEEFTLSEVPYVNQEEKHYSGAAVAEMILKYYELEHKSQETIACGVGMEEWNEISHGTFSESLSRYLIRQGLLVSQYQTANHVGPECEDGIEITEVIRGSKEILGINHEFYKGMLVCGERPCILRLHFNGSQYPMPEQMLRRLDESGHCVLLVGYDEEGFLVHDPWDQDKWGGTRGGPLTHIPYDVLLNEAPPVNGCTGLIVATAKPKVRFLMPREAIYQNKTITLELEFEWPGITNIEQDLYQLSSLEARLQQSQHFEPEEDRLKRYEDKLSPGEGTIFRWNVIVGDKPNSYPVKATVRGRMEHGKVPWDESSKDINKEMVFHADRRLGIKDKEWLQSYGIRNDSNDSAHGAEAEQQNKED